MLAILDAVQKVSESVEKIKNDGVQKFPIAANIGDAVRQGDIYIQLIDPLDSAPLFYTRITTPSFPYQLAPGNTKGSRHCLEYSDGIELYIPEVVQILENQEANLDPSIARTLQLKINTYAESLAKADTDRKLMHYAITSDINDVLELSGPIFVLKNETTVSHPEHGDWVLPPGTYRCIFQRTVSVADNSIRRVLD